MKSKSVVWFAALALLALSAAASAQQPQRQFFLLYEDHVKPSMSQAYEASVKDLTKALADAKASAPAFETMAFSYEDFSTYCYLTPIPDFAALDPMEGEWMKVADKVGKERWKKIMEANAPTTDGYCQMVVEYLPALSYIPASPRLKSSEMPYFVDYYFYVLPGKEGEFKSLAKQIAALFKSKGISNGWNLYQVLVGESLPLFVVGNDAKDPLDFAEWDKKDTIALGDDFKTLLGKVVAICRKVENRPGWWRPDLSYHVTPAEPAKN